MYMTGADINWVFPDPGAARDQLIAHLASASTRARIMHWEEAECPDGDDWDLLQVNWTVQTVWDNVGR